MTTHFYRLRSIKSLIERTELKTQTIYFAPPTELNDPLEGLRELFWKGDAIVWTNLFRHYLFCLHRTFASAILTRDNDSISADTIPIRANHRKDCAPRETPLLELIWRQIVQLTDLTALIRNLASSPRNISRDELFLYLQILHHIAVPVWLSNTPLAHRSAPPMPPLPRPPEHFSKTPAVLDTEANTHNGLDSLVSLFDAFDQTLGTVRLLEKYHRSTVATPRTHIPRENLNLIFLDFPKAYLRSLETLIYPDWYTACFLGDYRNSSVWGHYAAGHTGVCLIFRPEKVGGEAGLTLQSVSASPAPGPFTKAWNRGATESFPLAFHEVTYDATIGETDFFRSIGNLPMSTLWDSWYTDRHGDRSTCCDHIDSDDEDRWRNNYWRQFVRGVTSKTKDWAYEKEYRLILNGSFGDIQQKENRKLTYDFECLEGIIFGINTKDTDKVKILRIIRDKCREQSRQKFDIYQVLLLAGG